MIALWYFGDKRSVIMEKHVLSSTMADPVKRGSALHFYLDLMGEGGGVGGSNSLLNNKTYFSSFLVTNNIKCSQFIKHSHFISHNIDTGTFQSPRCFKSSHCLKPEAWYIKGLYYLHCDTHYR